VANLCTGHVAAGAQSDLIWMHRLVIAEVPPTVQNESSMCAPSRGVATLRDRWRSPARLAQGRPGQSTPVTVPAG